MTVMVRSLATVMVVSLATVMAESLTMALVGFVGSLPTVMVWQWYFNCMVGVGNDWNFALVKTRFRFYCMFTAQMAMMLDQLFLLFSLHSRFISVKYPRHGAVWWQSGASQDLGTRRVSSHHPCLHTELRDRDDY